MSAAEQLIEFVRSRSTSRWWDSFGESFSDQVRRVIRERENAAFLQAMTALQPVVRALSDIETVCDRGVPVDDSGVYET
jgi:hypothetical protein